jgi:hypothetical protein
MSHIGMETSTISLGEGETLLRIPRAEPIARRGTGVLRDDGGAHLPRKALYHVDFRLAGAPSVTSVQFDYRHGR